MINIARIIIAEIFAILWIIRHSLVSCAGGCLTFVLLTVTAVKYLRMRGPSV